MEYKFTLENILRLIDRNGESDERIILSHHPEPETWVIAPMNSELIRAKDNLSLKVSSICVCDDKLQIWLADKG